MITDKGIKKLHMVADVIERIGYIECKAEFTSGDEVFANTLQYLSILKIAGFVRTYANEQTVLQHRAKKVA